MELMTLTTQPGLDTQPAVTTKKVLIVDNERPIRILLTQALDKLTRLGVELYAAENGVEALKLIDVQKPDLVFLDLMMPGLHGFDVCRLIKSHPDTAKSYIIILTARNQSVDRQMGRISGADEYMVKPFDPTNLADKAMGILGIVKPTIPTLPTS